MLNYEEFVQRERIASNGYFLLFAITLILASAFIYSQRNKEVRFKNLIRIPLWLSLGIGFFVRIPSLFEAFWYDETFTANIATATINSAMTVILSDVHPPLAYLPFWIIGQVTSNPIFLRLPSFIAGMGIIWLGYLIGENWGKRVAQYSALFAAIMPSLIWFSVELRAYSIFTFISLIAVYGFMRGKDKYFFAAIAILPLIHAYGYLYSFVFGMSYIYGNLSMKRFRNLALSALPAILWLPFMLMQSNDVLDGFWIQAPTLGTALYPLTQLTVTTAYPAIAAMVIIPTSLFCTFLAIWHNRQNVFFINTLFIVPLVVLIISYLISPIYLYRAMLPSSVILVFFFARWAQYAPRLSLVLIACLTLTISMKLHPSAQRINTNEFVAQCGDRPIYTVTVDAAMIANHHSSNQIYVYSESNNLNQTLPIAALNALNMEVKNLAPLDSCIYWQDTPLTTQAQRDNLALSIQVTGNQDKVIVFESETLVIEVYR